ncbi:MAG: YegP family protein [Candidatus Methanomethylophilaceae archaeon]|nr:YegP family protein [Candidatus Methanomethylophilaceae archaeon]MBQ9689445.1 YegP family protein [Candidatus Methanomethylophilaceae archaeon]MBR1452012.1 YegP family protein [Candidatus Methanomethylophilaceae archaeon]MBR4202500.1 YegP family protein [Candidatus Methanomethylophilaceae archaeon]MBR6910419.1 YegP family protein [Candidatus Methanomethylophilaceae archaeon]
MGKFAVKKTSNEGYAFTIVANNGEVVGVSQTYKSRDAMNNGIESVRKNANVEIEDQTLENVVEKPCPKWEIYFDKAREYRFRLKASNGEIILAASEGYTTRASAKNGIESIQNNIDSEIVEEE